MALTENTARRIAALTAHEAELFTAYRAQQDLDEATTVCDSCNLPKPVDVSLYCDECGCAIALEAVANR